MAIINSTFRAYIEKLGATEAANFIGNEGDLFYDPNTASLRVSDGTTPGGIPVAGVTTVSGPIQQSLVPDADNAYDLGSPTNQWRDLYLTNNTMYMGGTKVSIASSSLAVDDQPVAFSSEVQDTANSTTLYANTDRRIYQDGDMGVVNPNGSGGWFYENGGPPASAAQPNKINWWFFMQTPNVEDKATLGDIKNAWCLFTPWSLNTQFPFWNIYTLPELSLGNAAAWYRSRITYSAPNQTHTPGTPVLLWFGSEEPTAYPAVPRVQMTRDALTSEGPENASETIMSFVLGTNSIAAASSYKFSTANVGAKVKDYARQLSLYATDSAPEARATGITTSVTVDGVTLSIVNGVIASIT